MRKANHRLTLLAALGTACAVVLPAAAQEPLLRFELTPYGAYRFGGEFESQPENEGDPVREFDLREGNAQGLMLDIRTNAGNTQWEVLYAHQATEIETQATFTGGPVLDLDVEYFQFGGTYLFDDKSDSTVPFVAMTAGVARFDPDLGGVEAESYFSGSLGGGVQLRANKRVGVRLEARAFATLVDDDSTLFCASGPAIGGACALSVNGTALFQFEARAGVVIRF